MSTTDAGAQRNTTLEPAPPYGRGAPVGTGEVGIVPGGGLFTTLWPLSSVVVGPSALPLLRTSVSTPGQHPKAA